MTKFLEDGRVVGQRSLSHDIRIMEIWSPKVAASAEPGQFVTVKSSELSVPLLRRPFGVSGVNRDKGTFLLIYRIVGEATQLLDQLRKGDSISVLGPLGRGFDRTHRKVLLVGGGVGLAPLRFLAEDYPNADVDVLIGARTAEELFGRTYFGIRRFTNLRPRKMVPGGRRASSRLLWKNSLMKADTTASMSAALRR